MQTREWENKEGQKQRTTEVQAQTVQFLGSPRGEGAAQGGGAVRSEQTQPRGAGGGSSADGDSGAAPAGPPPDEEIPF